MTALSGHNFFFCGWSRRESRAGTPGGETSSRRVCLAVLCSLILTPIYTRVLMRKEWHFIRHKSCGTTWFAVWEWVSLELQILQSLASRESGNSLEAAASLTVSV